MPLRNTINSMFAGQGPLAQTAHRRKYAGLSKFRDSEYKAFEFFENKYKNYGLAQKLDLDTRYAAKLEVHLGVLAEKCQRAEDNLAADIKLESRLKEDY